MMKCFKGNKVADESTSNAGADCFMSDDRKCRDLIPLLIFICWWIGMFVVAGVAVANGDPWRLIYPTDYEGNTCDSYAYYPHPSYDIDLYGDSSDWRDIKFFGICVDSCPKTDTYVCTYRLVDDDQHVYSGNDTTDPVLKADLDKYVEWTECAEEGSYSYCSTGNLEDNEGCWKLSVDSSSYFWRCLEVTETEETTTYRCDDTNIPIQNPCGEDGQTYNDNDETTCCLEDDYAVGICMYLSEIDSCNVVVRITDTEEVGVDVNCDEDGNCEEEDDVLLDQLQEASQLWDQYLGDVMNAWEPILLFGAVYALLAGFLWLVLLKLIAPIMVWLSIFGFLLAMIAFTLFCYAKGGLIDDEALDEVSSSVSENDDGSSTITESFDSSGLSDKSFLYLGHVMAVITLIFLLLFMGIRKKIQIALGILNEASRAVRAMPTVVFYPILTFALLCGMIVYGLAIAAYLATSGDISADDVNDQIGYDALPTAEETMTPTATNSSGFGAPDYVEMSSFAKGLLAYHVFGILWGCAFILGFGELVIAGAIGQYYWTRDKGQLPLSPLLKSIKRALRYHLGSVAFGSAIIAIVQMIRIVLMYIDKRTKSLQDKNKLAKFVMKCCQCCMWCLEKFLKFINRNAYIIIAIKGSSFCGAAMEAFKLILGNITQIAAVNLISQFLLILGKLFISVSAAVFCFLYIDNADEYASGGSKELSSPFLPVFVCFLAALLVAYGFLSVYSMAIDTILLSFCLDRKLHEGPPNMYAPTSLTKYLKACKDAADAEKKAKTDAKDATKA
eukprot:Rmarinus@m.19045